MVPVGLEDHMAVVGLSDIDFVAGVLPKDWAIDCAALEFDGFAFW